LCVPLRTVTGTCNIREADGKTDGWRQRVSGE
jgi:hypothetical protein